MRVRAPAVAGSFYPEDPDELKKMITAFMDMAKPKKVDNLKALIVPHAGYIYSGPVAAYGYKLLKKNQFNKVVGIGPSHYGAFPGAAEDDASGWQTPLGMVKADLLSKIAKPNTISCYPQVHAPEHCLEVQLPFLQMSLGEEFLFYPLLTGAVSPPLLADIVEPALDDDTLLLISSDLSHYYPYADAVKIDRIANESIPKVDLKKAELVDACGRIAILTALHIAKSKGWRGAFLDYRNSGDTAGPKSGVVGYGAYALYGV